MAYNPVNLPGPFTEGQIIPVGFELEAPEDLYITVDGVVVSNSLITWETPTSIRLLVGFPFSGTVMNISRRTEDGSLHGLLTGEAALDYSLVNRNDNRLLMLVQELKNNADSSVSLVLSSLETIQQIAEEVTQTATDIEGAAVFRVPYRSALATFDMTGEDHVLVARYDATSMIDYAVYKRVVSAPSHTLSAQDATGAWFEIAEGTVSLAMAGGPADRTQNASTALNRLISYARGQFSTTALGFKVQLSLNGVEWVLEDSIDITNLRQSGLVIMNGHLHGKCAGRAIWDIQGTQGLRVYNVSFHGDKTTRPSMALWLARAAYPLGSGAFGVAGDHVFIGCKADGYFGATAVLNYGSEVVTFIGCRWANRSKVSTRGAVVISADSDYNDYHFGALVSDFITGSNRLTGATSCIDHNLGFLHIRRPSAWSPGSIVSITKASPAVMTLAAPIVDSAFSEPPVSGDRANFHDIVGMEELNDVLSAVYLKKISDTIFELYTDPALTTPVNSTTYGTFTSGLLWSGTGVPLIITAGVADVTGEGGYLNGYSSDSLLLTARFGNSSFTGINLRFQAEADLRRVVRCTPPPSGRVSIVNCNIEIVNRNQTPYSSYLAADVNGSGYCEWSGGSFKVFEDAGTPVSGWCASKPQFKFSGATVVLPKKANWVGSTGWAGTGNFVGRVTFSDTVDDIEIGEDDLWTPVLKFGGVGSSNWTYTSSGWKRSVGGGMVLYHFRIQVSAKAAGWQAGDVIIEGLGTQEAGTGQEAVLNLSHYQNLTLGSNIMILGRVSGGNNYVTLRVGSPTITGNMNDTHLTATSVLEGEVLLKEVL